MAEVTSFRNNALPYPVYGVAWAVVFPLLDADGDPISPSSPDSERSLNGDTFADCTNEAVEIATSSGICYLLLTAAEMTADIVTVRIQSTGAKTTVITLYPRKLPVLATGTCQGANDTGDIQLASGDSAIDDNYNGCLIVAVIDSVTESRIINDYVGSTKVAEIAPAWNTAAPDSNDTYTIYLPEGRQVSPVNVTHVGGTAQTAGDIIGDTNDIQTNLATVAGYLDTEIAAIKTVVDGIQTDLDNGTDGLGALKTLIDAVDNFVDTEIGAIQAVVDAIEVDTQDIQGRLPAALVGGRMDSSVEAMATDVLTANALNSDAKDEIRDGLATIDNQTAILNKLSGLCPVNGTIGATGNTTTTLHLAGLTYGNDEINSVTLVIYDVSASEYHFRWIEDWADTGDLATVATLPFTPQASTDLYWILPNRSDVTGGSGLDAAGVRAALGMAAANMDTQLDALPTNAELTTALASADDATLAAIATLQTYVDTEVAAILAAVDTEVAAIKAKTDNLPASPANEATLTTIAGYIDTEVASILAAVDTEIAAIKAKTDNLPTDPADASDIATSFASIASTLSTLAAYVDTEVAAIKAKTDSLTFTVANVLDANIQRVNDVAVAGTGASGDEWGPA